MHAVHPKCWGVLLSFTSLWTLLQQWVEKLALSAFQLSMKIRNAFAIYILVPINPIIQEK